MDTLRQGEAQSLSLVAEKEGQLVGHIAISLARVGEDESGWYLLGPIGVLPEHQGTGVGSALMRAVLERMRTRGARGIILVGDSEFYGRFGFTCRPGLDYPGVPAQYVLALTFAGAELRGEIRAHPAFFGSE